MMSDGRETRLEVFNDEFKELFSLCDDVKERQLKVEEMCGKVLEQCDALTVLGLSVLDDELAILVGSIAEVVHERLLPYCSGAGLEVADGLRGFKADREGLAGFGVANRDAYGFFETAWDECNEVEDVLFNAFRSLAKARTDCEGDGRGSPCLNEVAVLEQYVDVLRKRLVLFMFDTSKLTGALDSSFKEAGVILKRLDAGGVSSVEVQ